MYENNDYRNYLMHHGILGQRWGIRQYQPYSTTGPRKGGKTGKEIGEAKFSKRKAQKSLNKLDADRALLVGQKNRASKQVQKAQKKFDKAANKDSSDRKIEKRKSALTEAKSNLKAVNSSLSEIKKDTKSILDSVKANNFGVKITNMKRSTQTVGQRLSASLLLGNIGGTIYNSAHMTIGKHYKLKKI